MPHPHGVSRMIGMGCMMRSFSLALLSTLLMLMNPAAAQAAGTVEARSASQCQAIAHAIPGATFAGYTPAALAPASKAENGEVTITLLGHATFFIETPGGVAIATDFSGAFPTPYTPDAVTMNRAHPSHYTLNPDPAIRYVLHGWSDTPGEKAKVHLQVGDTLIRNVVTDIRSGYDGGGENGNSIFIFEVAGLCIGHLGHLHFELTDQQYGEIGRLDVLMVPVDGGLTMGADSMSRVVKRLRASLILPMHRLGPPMDQFLAMFGSDFDIGYAPGATIKVSLASLPSKPLIYVLNWQGSGQAN
jgi:L-ascorbate metabolism protein UlaG (beta-lactamase superfamily)